MKDVNKFAKSEEPWFCWDCNLNNINNILFGTCQKKKTKPVKPGKPFCRICNEKNNHVESAIKYNQCSHLIHKKCLKTQNKKNIDNEVICSVCISENFAFTNISNNEILENAFNSNYSYACLNNCNTQHFKGTNQDIFNVKELNFCKNQNYAQNDPEEQLIENTSFDFYTIPLMNSIN